MPTRHPSRLTATLVVTALGLGHAATEAFGDAAYEVTDTLIELTGDGLCAESSASASYSFHPSMVLHTPLVFDSLDAAPIDLEKGATNAFGGQTTSRAIFVADQTDTTMFLVMGGRAHASMPTATPGHYVANTKVEGHVDFVIDHPTTLHHETCIHATTFYSNGILEIQRLTAAGEEPLDLFQNYQGNNVICQDGSIELEPGDYRISFFAVASAVSSGWTPSPKNLHTMIETELEFVPMPKPGDVTGDGVVDGADLARILGSFGTSATGGDLNGDGIVDGADIAIVLAHWG